MASDNTFDVVWCTEVVEHLTGSALSVMFWAAVLAYHPEYAGPDGLTVIHSYMDARNAPAITQAVMDAFIASLPPAQQEAIRAERGEPEPPGNGRPTRPVPAPTITTGRAGSSSGPLPDTISDSPGMNLAN